MPEDAGRYGEMKLGDIKNIVVDCLTNKPKTRNSDRLLYNEVCTELGFDTHSMTAWEMLHNPDMPSTESVRRARQKAQVEFPELRATEQVQKKRDELKLDYLEFARG